MSLILFLGGTTNKSTWRDDLIPSLKFEGLKYYNPVVKNWTPKDKQKEDEVKALPNCVELYVITSKMKGVYSIAEVVEASNKKPEKTIFLAIRDGFDKDQLKSLDAVESILKKNGVYIAISLQDIVDKFKKMNIVYNKPKKSHKKISYIFDQLENLVVSAKDMTYLEMFDILGISSMLEDIYLSPTDLKKEYRDAIFQSVKKFLENPLFKGLDLKNKDDLEFLKKSEIFEEFMNNIFSEIEKKVEKYKDRVTKEMQRYSPEEEVSIDKIIKETNVDRNTLMFILKILKDDKEIYDFNGRNVTIN